MKRYSDKYLKDWNKFINDSTPAFAEFFHKEQLFYQSMVHEGYRVLDIGSGTGRIACAIAPYVGEKGVVYAIERNEKMHANLYSYFNNIRYTKHPSDVRTFNKSIDVAIFSCNGFGNIPQTEAHEITERIRMLLARNQDKGAFIGAVYSEDAAPYQIEQYKKIGWNDVYISNDTVCSDSLDFVSKRYTQDELLFFLEKYFDTFSVGEISPIAYGFIGARAKGSKVKT